MQLVSFWNGEKRTARPVMDIEIPIRIEVGLADISQFDWKIWQPFGGGGVNKSPMHKDLNKREFICNIWERKIVKKGLRIACTKQPNQIDWNPSSIRIFQIIFANSVEITFDAGTAESSSSSSSKTIDQKNELLQSQTKILLASNKNGHSQHSEPK